MAESPVGYFPDLQVQWDARVYGIHKTEVEEARNGREQRRALYDAQGYWRYEATSIALSVADRQVLADFLKTKRGRLGAFYFFRPDPAKFVGVSIGSVSSQTTIVAPFKSATFSTVYVAGLSKTFTIQSGVGPGGEDQITFTGGAQTGAVTADINPGRQRIVCRFDSDEIENFFFESAGVFAYYKLALKEVR